MAISKVVGCTLLLVALAAPAREAATPAACQAAGAQPPILGAKDRVVKNAADLNAIFKLADAWSDAGCFNEALQVLSAAAQSNPINKELNTRLRVARSVVGEEHFFENLDRADDQARLKRASFRCTSLADAEACGEAVRFRPDDAALWSAQGDALMHINRPADALNAYKHAASLKPDQPDLTAKMMAAQHQAPAAAVPIGKANATVSASSMLATHRSPARFAREAPRNLPQYSNVEPEARSH